MQSAKHKLSTQGSILFQSHRARSMQAQFLLDTVIYWYVIETLCKLYHTFLKRKQTPIIFVNPNYKSNTLQTKSIVMKQDLKLHESKRSVVLANDLSI